MTRKQGREYLFQQLKPLVPSDSLDMVLEYLCSYDPINTQDMLTFLHDVCSNHNNLNDILQKYVEICNQLDTNSTIFVPKQYHQENRKHKENHSSEQSSKTISQTQSSQNSRQSNNHQKKKNHQAPGVSEPITFVGTGKKNEKQHRKQPSSSHNNSNKKNTDISTRHLCGCFATHHDFYTSCLSCGRIHCSLEGPGQCVFCGLDLIPPLSADIACEVLGAPNDEVVLGAYLQKDKLLTFDKEHAKRTQVHDAQGDYYETGTWLTQEEKDEIAEKEKKRLEKYQSRGRQPTKVSFDLAGRKIYETTQEEIDCSCDNKDDDHAHHISETTKLRETISNVINTSSDELTMDLSTLSLENLSLANAYSKHAIMYRTLREKLLAQSKLAPNVNEKENDNHENGQSNLLLGPAITTTSVNNIHQLKVQHALE